MDAWNDKFVLSDTKNIKGDIKSKDVLLELRTMNNLNIEFYKFMMGEFTNLRENGDAQKIADLENKMNQKHLEFEDKLESVKAVVVKLQQKEEEQDAKITKLLEKEEEQDDKVLELECRSRKLNLIIPNLAEKLLPRQTRGGQHKFVEETYAEIQAKVVDFLSNKLGILGAGEMLFRNIHRLGKRNPTHKRPRATIVAFLHQPDVDLVLSAAKEKKDPAITVRTDLPKSYNEIRNALLKIRKDYRDATSNLPDEEKIKCRLTYIKFKPTLFKKVGENGDETLVEIERGGDGEYKEVLVVTDPDT